MSTVDVVARLQLRAEQFASETGARFAEMKTRAQSAAASVRQEFTGAFAEVQKLAAGALVMPRTKSGSLDLSSEIGQLRNVASAADQQAISLRELAVAKMAVANSGRADAEALRLEADAAAVGSLAAEKSAIATRERIAALEAVQVELNRTTSATVGHNDAAARYVASAGQQRASTIMLGQQLQDFFVQTSNGTAITTAFSQQIGQAGFALQGMGGAAGAAGAFMGSLAGTGVLLALTVLPPLIAKWREHNNALDDAVGKLKADADQSRLTAQAKAEFARSVEGLTAALVDQDEALRKTAASERTAAEQSNIQARATRDKTLAVREATLAQLENAQARLTALSTPGATDARLAPARMAAEADVARLTAAVEKARKNAVDAERQLNVTHVDLAAEQAAIAVDPIRAVTKLYDDRIKALKDQKREEASLGKMVGAATKQRIQELEAEKAKAIETAQARQQAERQAARSATRAGPLTTFLSPVSGATSGRFGDPRPGHTHGGIDYAVPVGTPVRAPAAGTVDVAGNRQGYGNAIYINFGGGTSGRFGHLSKFNVKLGDTVNAGDIIGYTGGAKGAEGSGTSSGPHLHYEVRRNGRAVDPRTGRFPTDAGQAADAATKRRDEDAAKAERAAKAMVDLTERSATSIARINSQWDDQPRLIDRARLQSAELDAVIADLEKRKPEGFKELVEQAKAAKDLIQSGLTRPFEDYVRAQRESMAVGQLVLQGRDAEAAALQDSLRLMQQQGYVSDEQLATVLQLAQQQERIAESLEDQRAIVGIYSGAVGDLQRKFEDFLGGLRTKPVSALKNLVTGALGTFQQLQDNLLSNAIFGGIDRDIEKYVRKMTGQQTPAEILETQAGDAGKQLRGQVDNAGTALDEFTRAVRSAAGGIGGVGGVGGGASPVASLLSGGTVADVLRDAALEMGNAPAANDNDARRLVENPAETERVMGQMMKAGNVFGVGLDRFAKNLSRLGIEMPKSVVDGLKKHVPTVLQGASFGQMGGSVFASITGGKNNSTASAVGGVLGEIAGKEIGKTVGTAATGLLKTLGGAAGPIGAVAGGILGSVIGGLFKKKSPSGSVDITGTDAGSATASGKLGSALTGNASSVQKSLTQIAEQLGAVTGAFSVSIGKSGDWYHVAGTAGADVSAAHPKSPLIYEGKDEAAAVQAAVLNALQDGAIKGISEAAQRILRSGQDLDAALNKALLIEAIPKDLKRMLDPVGAAVDELNRKWQKTYNALREGGAGAEQMAEAQQLYNLQLAETKAQTKSASDTLRTFLDSFKVGSASPYSLRDQETAAQAALKPFLDQIAGGQAIDQGKYQAAAQSYLDIERQLYGSTDKYFDKLDMIQAATASAISKIDNAVPITPGVPDPFTKAAAEAIKTGNEIADGTNALLSQAVSLLQQVVGNTGGGGGGSFIGADRNYLSAA